MTQPNFTTSVRVAASPEKALAAILNIRGWWSENVEGPTDKLGASFNYRYKDLHRCVLRLRELIPGRKAVWHVEDNYFSFTKDQNEWKDSELVFELAPRGDTTEIIFTHRGLTPKDECYGACSEGWTTYVGDSLKKLVETGKGRPNEGEARTASEERLATEAPTRGTSK